MGHIRNGEGVYGRLQKRLDRFPVGAPPAAALYEILKRLYTEEEAEIAARMPIIPIGLDGIARRTKKSPAALLPILERMADKGLVMDFVRKGKTSYVLSPTLVGFFEFAFMRVRDDIPQKEIARHMVAYAHDDPAFARSVFAGKTQVGRTLIHEAAFDPAKCSGCGLCAKRCPVSAIRIEGEGNGKKAALSPGACLGCGVCKPACNRGALAMSPRKERVVVPETAWQRWVVMAIERGKFQNLLFDDFDRLDHAALRAVTRIVIGLPPVKKALLSRQVQSRFFRALAGG